MGRRLRSNQRRRYSTRASLRSIRSHILHEYVPPQSGHRSVNEKCTLTPAPRSAARSKAPETKNPASDRGVLYLMLWKLASLLLNIALRIRAWKVDSNPCPPALVHSQGAWQTAIQFLKPASQPLRAVSEPANSVVMPPHMVPRCPRKSRHIAIVTAGNPSAESWQ